MYWKERKKERKKAGRRNKLKKKEWGHALWYRSSSRSNGVVADLATLEK